MIDILKDKPPVLAQKQEHAPKSFNASVLLAVALAWVVYDTAYWRKFVPAIVVPAEKSAQVLFVT